MRPTNRILGDSPDRSYASKLSLFADFAAPELREIVSELPLAGPRRVLDLGCGTGLATSILADMLSPALVVGLDLSLPHLQAARSRYPFAFVQGDAEAPCIRDSVFDFIWLCNTINHVADSESVLRTLRRKTARDGYVALVQSGFLPEMFFPWDSPLDDAVRSACYDYYRDRYQLSPEDTAGIRGLLRLMQNAEFESVNARTYVIERTQPLAQSDRDYFSLAVFEGTWGDRIRPYLREDDWLKLKRYCDPISSDYCLDRRDFHHVQTLTVCVGRVPD